MGVFEIVVAGEQKLENKLIVACFGWFLFKLIIVSLIPI